MARALSAMVLLLLLGSAAQAGPFRFVDEWTFDGLPAYGQASAGLATVKPDALKAAPEFPAGTVRYGTFVLKRSAGSGASVVVALVEPTGGDKALYVDANADGALTEDERARVAAKAQRPPGFGKPGETIWITELRKPSRRTVAFRLGPFPGLITCAARGFARGQVPLGSEMRDAILVDSNASMILERGADCVYVDLNRDGRLQPETERFPLLPRITIGGTPVQFAVDTSLRRASAEAAPRETVSVQFTVGSLPGQPEKVVASLSGMGGDIVQVNTISEPTSLPADSYSLDSLFIAASAEGAKWTYSFTATGGGPRIEPQGGASVDLLGKMSLGVSCTGELRPGGTIRSQVDARTSTGLTMRAVTQGGREISLYGELPATVELVGPDGSVLVKEKPTSGG